METFIDTGEDAIDIALGIPHDATVTEHRYGYCCDMGNYGDVSESTRERVLWCLLNYRDSIKRGDHILEAHFSAHKHGGVNRAEPITIKILDTDCGESSHLEFECIPANYYESE